MCKNCKASELGVARQAELDAALAECQALNVNPAIASFLVSHALQHRIPRHERMNVTEEQVEVVKRYVGAKQAMKKLHEDYVWSLARKDAEERRGRVVTSIHIECGKPREASADPHLRDLDLSELGISPEQAACFDRIAIKQDTIAREDAAWLEVEQRS